MKFAIRKIKNILYLLIWIILTACPSQNLFILELESQREPRKDIITVNIDKDFSKEQMLFIEHAFLSWHNVSNKTIKFNIIWDTPKPKDSTRYLNPKSNAGIFMWYISKEDYYGNEASGKKTQGLYVPGATDRKDNNSANILIFNEMKDDNLTFINTVTHEIGHMLRLRHTKYKHAIMYPYISNRICITQLDAADLCSLYGCTANPECYVSKDY